MGEPVLAIDLFSGAGGMSLGAKMSGVEVIEAVELDTFACATYMKNFTETPIKNIDIVTYTPPKLPRKNSIVFGGPPCQGYSTSNQKTRSKDNSLNWMFSEFIRIVNIAKPEWVVFENVKGLLDTAKGFFLNYILNAFEQIGYTTTFSILNSLDFAIPQVRSRLFIIGNRKKVEFNFPLPQKKKCITVGDAISDLPSLENGAMINSLPYRQNIKPSAYARRLRGRLKISSNNLVTKNADYVIKRYSFVPQGGNWTNIPPEYFHNYKDHTRCHTGIYRRLDNDKPSIVLGNFRKNMLIHPTQDRGLSVREAARIQSFPDSFEFMGSIGFQQQQVGNAVPPLLAKAVFDRILNH